MSAAWSQTRQLRKDRIDERVRVIEEARSWIGTPWHHMGRIKGKDGGVDCAMLLAEVYPRALGMAHIEVAPYEQQWHLHKNVEVFLAILGSYTKRVRTPLPGDIALFKLGKVYSHGSIVVEWPKQIIHANLSSGIVELCEIIGNPQLERCETLFFSPWSE
jgi:cell wall-associated NlpC family hydrolase